MHPLVQAILAPDAASKVGVFERFTAGARLAELLEAGKMLHGFALDAERNAYQRVRAAFYAHALYRYALPRLPELPRAGKIPWHAHELLLERRYASACDALLAAMAAAGPSDALASALASAYHGLGFQILAGQVQRSVRALRGNRWMFRTAHALDLPLRVRPELLGADASGFGHVLVERTPVRMDLSHSGWSDIFFLGMDYPEGARVLNVSVDLAVRGRDQKAQPPITCFFRVIDEPVLRLASVDLDAAADLTEVAEVFDYARDYLGLLKAAVIAAGLVPPALEGSGQPLRLVLEQLVGPGRGIELVSQVSDIPKGSRLAVSTNLLGGLISLCMRATGQVSALTGSLDDTERRTVAGRAILGEWLGGSGGGWQDSGGLWPGIKLIEGMLASAEDVEYGSSRGRLLPRHTILEHDVVSPEARKRLEDSLVLVHGGMAANVGPILEIVTEKFLLGTTREWEAREELLATFDAIVAALRAGDVRELGRLTTRAFRGPLEAIVPWVTNAYTERLIREAEAALGSDFWGFWMLGGMSGGGMGFIVDPRRKAEAERLLLDGMRAAKRDLETSLPFAMEPVVYGFSINEAGTSAELLSGQNAILSPEYYAFQLPRWHEQGSRSFSSARRRELDAFANEHLRGERAASVSRALVRRLFPSVLAQENGPSLDALLERYGFDPEQHERIRRDLLAGRIGLAQNRLPADTVIEDVRARDVTPYASIGDDAERLGRAALARGEACVVTLAAGAGSRWTQGAGTVKALHPFAKLGGRFRTFVEVHLAKTACVAEGFAAPVPPHVFTTSFLTHAPLERLLEREGHYGFGGRLLLSQGSSIGLRLVPTARDLRFAWEQMPQQKLEERKEKVRDSGRKALLDWVADKGEASDYRDNVAPQCVHPVGHFYEIANLVINGTLRRLLEAQPSLQHFLVHNIDTLGADLEPRLFGRHLESQATFSFEVIERRLEDRGGGLARVGGRPRIVEGLALPRDDDEAKLGFYNSLTTWVSIDPLLGLFGLTRETLADEALARRGVRSLAARLPTYVTLKEVKRRWGNAQEDVLTVAQFEKLWGDVSALPDVPIEYFVVPRERGQQLKDVAQLDGWARDGSREYIERITGFVE